MSRKTLSLIKDIENDNARNRALRVLYQRHPKRDAKCLVELNALIHANDCAVRALRAQMTTVSRSLPSFVAISVIIDDYLEGSGHFS